MNQSQRASTCVSSSLGRHPFHDAVADTAATPITAEYTGILAAADIFTHDNAWTLLESLRIDTGILGPFGNHP
ncbi:hypothetical protein [Streptomyces sp. NPDC091209]|uniref:hypothetical protein n=1 Tax=Streptomyces sp. NPDC091209 TaxID=3365974 RepID=UPI00381B91E7